MDQDKFIRDNYLLISGKMIARTIGRSSTYVRNFLKANKLNVPKATIVRFRSEGNIGKTKVTPAQDKIIKRKYLKVPVKTLAHEMGLGETVMRKRLQQLNLVIPADIIAQRKRDSQIKPGHVPLNKGKKQADYMCKEAIARTKSTRFKKGQLPHNAIGFKDGDISIRHDHKDRNGKAYKYIRLSLGKWYPLHQHRWEKKNGKLPKGHCLWFKDGNTLNCTLKNLELITRAENMRRNSCSLNLTDNYIATALSRVKGIRGSFDKDLARELVKNKPLIELQRQHYLLKRTIKSKENGQQKKR